MNKHIFCKKFVQILETPQQIFDLKIVYSYVIEIAGFQISLGLYNWNLVAEILVFYHLQENALRQPACRGPCTPYT